jgi:hypothetical protein
MGAPTRYPSGVTNVTKQQTLGMYPDTDPTKTHTFFDDFDQYRSGEWTVTETQAGATQAVVDADGGILALTNSAADNDVNQLQKVGESFRLEVGKEAWIKIRAKVSDATNTDVNIGLVITDTDIVGGVTDGWYFSKAEDATTLVFRQVKNSSASTVNAGTVANDTYFVCGAYYDGKSTTTVYFNDVAVGSIDSTANLCDDEDLTVTISLQNGSAAAHVLSCDYFFAAKAR